MELSKELLMKFYTDMVRIRKLDEVLIKGVYSGKVVSFYHSGLGQEAVGVATVATLKEDDYLFYNHRSHGTNKALPRGMSAESLIAEHYGKVNGCCKGLGGIVACNMKLGLPGFPGTVGGYFTVAAGMAIAAKMRGKGQIVVCDFGDGATGRGTFHTGMLMSANWKLPIVWLCENNLMGQWVPIKIAYPKENLADLAFGYGIPSAIVDGQDVIAVYEAVHEAVERVRKGGGPTFLECKTFRYRGHSEGRPIDFQAGVPGKPARDPEEIETWKKRDPIDLFREKLLKKGILTQANIERIDHEATHEMEEAEKLATESPISGPEILEKVLYAD